MPPHRPEHELQKSLQGFEEPDVFHIEEDCPPPAEINDLAQHLAALGGLASSHELAVQIDPSMTIRQMRDHLKNRTDIRKLGGGYYALAEHPAPNLEVWVTRWLGTKRLPEQHVLDAIQEHWPHGHRPSIRAWLHQDPGPIRFTQGEIWIFRSKRSPQ